MSVFVLTVTCAVAFAGNKDKEEKKEEANGKVYIFGVGTSFADSTIYISEVVELKDFALEKKTKFLPYRSEFSIQMKQYLEGHLGLMSQTCCVFFSDNKQKISKKYYKVKKRYLDDMDVRLTVIDSHDFKFEKPVIGEQAETAEEKKAEKQ